MGIEDYFDADVSNLHKKDQAVKEGSHCCLFAQVYISDGDDRMEEAMLGRK